MLLSVRDPISNIIKSFGAIKPSTRHIDPPRIKFNFSIFVWNKIECAMNQIITYLTFNGNCREAMEFYQECLGGELKLQTLEDTQEKQMFPNHIKDYVVQAALEKNGMLLMGTDMVDKKLVRGNSISILLGA